MLNVSMGNTNPVERDVSNLVSLWLTLSTIRTETGCYFRHAFVGWVIIHLERSDEAV